MPTLVQFNASLNKGSTGRIAEQIGLTAQNHGWDVYSVHGNYHKNHSLLHTIQSVSPLEEKWDVLMTRLCDKHGLVNNHSTRKVIEQVKALNPDVIHIHNLHGYYLNYTILFQYLRQSKIPVVWTLHDCWPFTGHCGFFDTVHCDMWKSECHNCPLKHDYPTSIADGSRRNFRIKRASFTSISENITLVPVSKWLEGLVKQSFLKDCKIRTIHNGVDINIFKSKTCEECSVIKKKYDIKAAHLILGCAAVWHERKGLNDFIMLKETLSSAYDIALVGVSDNQKKEIEKKGLIGISRTENQSELATLYSLADVYVNPTYMDNFPTTNIEALACGTPVVTYDTGGSSEAIDEMTGVVVERGNKKKLSETIIKIIDGELVFSEKDCRKRAEIMFNKNDRYMDYIYLYDKILTNRGG